MVILKVKKLTGFDRITGLIGAKKAYPVFLNTRFGIHTFGLKFNIDVIILNKKNEVVKTAGNLKPNRVFFWPLLYNKVLELPAGEIKKHKIRIGDKLGLYE